MIKTAKRYTEALFSLISGREDIILSEIEAFETALLGEELSGFLYHPAIKLSDKKSAIEAICKDFEPETLNFLYILLEENKINCIPTIKTLLKNKIYKKNNILEISVILSYESSLEVKDKIVSRLEHKFQKKIKANFDYDKNIIGGIILKTEDSLIDLSVKKKIESFKHI